MSETQSDSDAPRKSYLDPTVITAGQMYAFLLNANTCEVSEASKDAALRIVTQHPILRELPQNSRVFVRRAARFMAHNGITQIIDVGSGLPTDTNTHQVVQDIEPQANVVYVDNDPMAKEQAGDMLSETSDVNFVVDDMAHPEAILDHPDTRALVDFTQPVGLMMASILHLISEDHAQQTAGCSTHELVRRYIDALPPGSYVAFEHFTHEGQDPVKVDTIVREAGVQFRTLADIRAYLDGLTLVPPYAGTAATDDEPDWVWSNRWRSPHPSKADPTGSWIWAAVGHKP